MLMVLAMLYCWKLLVVTSHIIVFKTFLVPNASHNDNVLFNANCTITIIELGWDENMLIFLRIESCLIRTVCLK